jgi:polysaccharide export outer membrane protein
MFTNMALGVFRDAGGRRSCADAFGEPLGLRSATKSSRLLFGLYAVLCMATLGGCSILPHDGPSLDAVKDKASGGRGGYSLVDLNAQSSEIIESVPQLALHGLVATSSMLPVDLIGVGDGLTVTIFDRGSDALGVGPISNGTIPKLVVDGRGNIALPYTSDVHVAGMTTAQAAQAIDIALKGKTVSPQVVVTIVDNVANSVTILGEVKNPGRYPLGNGGDRLLDIVALAAGPTRPPGDTRVVVARGNTMAAVTLAQLMDDSAQNIRLAPRDQIRLLYAPRKFSTFGALVHSAEIPIEDESVTLAAALSRAGGLDPGMANASAVLVFRFERPQVATALAVRAPVSSRGVPIVYRLNFRKPEEVFVANHFQIESGDLIYVPRADYAEMQQFIGIVTAASTVAYNVRVTTAVVP